MNSMTMTLPNETALVMRAVEEPTAFADIFDHYFSHVYNYIRYRVGDAQVADDLTSTVFEKALSNLRRYNANSAPFGAWLFAIARNTVTDYHRRSSRRRWLPLDSVRDRAGDAVPPEALIIQKDTHAALLAAVQTLNERERDIIGLKFGAGLSNRRIAELTTLSESNVGVIIYRAVRRLREVMEANAS